MRSTLFYIPHDFLGVPLFGLGWALIILLIAAIVWLYSQKRSGQSLANIASGSWFWLLAAFLIVVVLPSIEQRWADGTPIGLPIRGYGLMVLLGMLSAVAITNVRAHRIGIQPDIILGLAIWAMLGGVLGARVFYVIQKWESFTSRGTQLIIDIVKLTEGGLVIYGGIIGGLVALGIYCWRHRLNILTIGDLVAPGFFIGLAFGRIGCLLHGCCWGAVCTSHLPTIQFPQGSLPYISQVERGQIIGLELSSNRLPSVIQSVQENGPADSAGIKAGEELRSITPHTMELGTDSDPAGAAPIAVELQLSTGKVWLEPGSIPQKSLPVHPSQIYASINAVILCVLTWLLQPLVTRRGTVLFAGVALYALSRFLLEWIRIDEKGQFGTQLTIAQWIAIVSGLLSVLAIVLVIILPSKASRLQTNS